MTTIKLVDLSGIWWRHWHGSVGKDVGAAYALTLGTVRHLLDGRDGPSGIAVDAGSSFRKEISPEYKSQRPDKDAAAMDQLRSVIERLESDGYKILRAGGWEADDVIATATRWARDQGHEVEIFSADKDLLALVGDGVHVVRPFEGDVWNAEAVATKFGVGPEMMPELLTLVGDKSDNIPGVRGIGAVNAAKLLRAFGSIPGILSAADDPESDITPAIRKAIVEGVAAIELSSKLIALRFDVPIDCSVMLEERVMKEQEEKSFDDDNFDNQDSEPPAAEAPPPPKSDPRRKATEPPEVIGEPVTQSSALAVVDWALALEPRTPRDAFLVARQAFESRVFPDIPNQAAAFTIILTGRSMGLSAMSSLRGIQMIKGKPCLSADILVGLCRNSPLCEYFKMVETSATRAVYRTKRTDERDPIEYEFTIEEAKARGFVFTSRDGKPAQWSTNPRGMLRAACKRELARMVYEEICAGVYTPDEMQDAA